MAAASVALVPDQSLRAYVERDPHCRQLLDEAMRLWRSLYEDRRDDHPIVGRDLQCHRESAVFHGIERRLDEIIFGGPFDAPGSFVPTAEEAVILRAAARVHRLGMLSGIFGERDKPGEEIYSEGGEPYADRTTRYLRDHWRAWCSWNDWQRMALAEVCWYQRPTAPFHKVALEAHGIRVCVLAALLRLAVISYMHGDFCPHEMRSMLKPNGVADSGRSHYGVMKWVPAIEFDHGSRSLVVHTTIPRSEAIPAPDSASLPAVLLDAHPAVEFVCDRLQDVLDSVSWAIEGFTNTCFKYVRHESTPVGGLGKLREHVPEIWIGLLAGVSCACEAASMTAVIVRQLVDNQDGEVPTDAIRDVLNSALALHPYNLLVRHLCRQVNDQLQLLDCRSAAARETILDTMDEYIAHRQTATGSVVTKARECIESAHVIVIYGYSKNVLTLLTKTGGVEGHVIVVPISERNPRVKNENRRVYDLLSEAGILFDKVQLARLSERLRSFAARGKTIRFLVGTRGVLRNRDVVSTVGNRVIAQIVKELTDISDAEVVVLAEPDKWVQDDATEKAVRGRIGERETVLAKKKPGGIGTPTHDRYDGIDILIAEKHYDRVVT